MRWDKDFLIYAVLVVWALAMVVMISTLVSGCAESYDEIYQREQARFYESYVLWEKYCPEGKVCK